MNEIYKAVTRRQMPQPKRSYLAKRQAIVDKFNADFPVGSWVVFRKGSEKVLTRVKDQAYLLRDFLPVAFFENGNGSYAIQGRVSKVKVITVGSGDPRLLMDIYEEAGIDSKKDVHKELDRQNNKTTYWQEVTVKRARRARKES